MRQTSRKLQLNLDGRIKDSPLRKRLGILRANVRRARRTKKTSWKKTFFQLNVFPGEYNSGVEISFDEAETGDVRQLKTHVSNLELQLEQMRAKLALSEESRQEKETTNTCLAESNAFLTQRLSAVEKEADTSHVENDQLKAQVNELTAAKKAEENDGPKILGRKRLSEIGPDAVKKTKLAYKKQVLQADKFVLCTFSIILIQFNSMLGFIFIRYEVIQLEGMSVHWLVR